MVKGRDYTRRMRLPCLLAEKPEVEKGGNYKTFQEPFGVEADTEDVLIIKPFTPKIIVGVHAL